ncbi:MAG: hypothetical protein A4E35_01853 [Methanoregula sp. PtaU1.Bin051]|nr:MAG: hypothetical protein A4E35_01853 [Methanoregula sp. PtaU1.Bin051]
MGILTEGINEVIATTRSNAAPMGIILRNGRFRMVCFTGSHTAENIARDRWVVANIVHDPVMYVTTAFSDLPDNAFYEEQINETVMHRLADAEAYIAFSAIIEQRGSESMSIHLVPIHEKVVTCKPHPVNRGFASIIEATVHATRYCMSHDPGLKNLIDYHAAIVRKCGGPRELEALRLLESFIH